MEFNAYKRNLRNCSTIYRARVLRVWFMTAEEVSCFWVRIRLHPLRYIHTGSKRLRSSSCPFLIFFCCQASVRNRTCFNSSAQLPFSAVEHIIEGAEVFHSGFLIPELPCVGNLAVESSATEYQHLPNESVLHGAESLSQRLKSWTRTIAPAPSCIFKTSVLHKLVHSFLRKLPTAASASCTETPIQWEGWQRRKISKQDNADGDHTYEEIHRMCNRGKRKTAWNMKPAESSIWNLIFKVRMESWEGGGHVKNWWPGQAEKSLTQEHYGRKNWACSRNLMEALVARAEEQSGDGQEMSVAGAKEKKCPFDPK